MSQPYSTVALAIQTVLSTGAHCATKYVSPKHVVKVTQRLLGGKPSLKNLDFVVTIGRPNYADSKFIKQCIKAGEPFPVKKLRLKFPGKRKAVESKVARAARRVLKNKGRASAKTIRMLGASVLRGR